MVVANMRAASTNNHSVLLSSHLIFESHQLDLTLIYFVHQIQATTADAVHMLFLFSEWRLDDLACSEQVEKLGYDVT